jgi:hypothetical protein
MQSGGTEMRYWLCGVAGAVIAGGYKAASLGGQWDLGREHMTRALGTVGAHAIIGVMIGLVLAVLLFSRKSEPGELRQSAIDEPPSRP